MKYYKPLVLILSPFLAIYLYIATTLVDKPQQNIAVVKSEQKDRATTTTPIGAVPSESSTPTPKSTPTSTPEVVEEMSVEVYEPPVIIYVTVTPTPAPTTVSPTPSATQTPAPTPTPHVRTVTFSRGSNGVIVAVENIVDSQGFNNESVKIVSVSIEVTNEFGGPIVLKPGDTFQLRGIQARGASGAGSIADYPVFFTTTSYTLNLSQPEAIVSGMFRPIVSYISSSSELAPVLGFRITSVVVHDDSVVTGLPQSN